MKKKIILVMLAMIMTVSACGKMDLEKNESITNVIDNDEGGDENAQGVSGENDEENEEEEDSSNFIERSDDIEELLSEENCKAYFDKEGMITAITYEWSSKDYDEDEEEMAYYISGDEVYSWEFAEINTEYHYRTAVIEAACMPGVHAFYEVGFKISSYDDGKDGEYVFDKLSFTKEVAPYAVIDSDEFCGSYSGEFQYYDEAEQVYKTVGDIVINITGAETEYDGDDYVPFEGDMVITLSDGSVYEIPIESASISPSEGAISISTEEAYDFGEKLEFDYINLSYDSDTNEFCGPSWLEFGSHWSANITKN